MLKFCNGIHSLSFIHGFRHFLLYSTSNSAAAEANPSLLKYLVKCLGFSEKQALSTSTKLAHRRLTRGAKKVSDFNFIGNADSVIAYLKQIGLEQSDIRKAVHSSPNILLCNVDKTLKPKTEIFLELGFSEHDFAEIIKVNPSIFFLGVETSIVPAIQSLRETLGSDSLVISTLKYSHGANFRNISKTLVPNIALLRDYGIPFDLIRKQLLLNDYKYWLFRKTENFQDAVIRVEAEFGIPRDAPLFLTGIRLLNSYKEKNINSKRQIFKTFGWAESDVVALFRSCPSLLSVSEAKMKEKLSFLMKELGYAPSYLALRSALLTCSLEKRIVPRHEVLRVLKEKGLIKMNYSLYSVITLSESKFLMRFVLPFKDIKEVGEVYAKHAGIISSKKLTLEFSKLNSNVV